MPRLARGKLYSAVFRAVRPPSYLIPRELYGSRKEASVVRVACFDQQPGHRAVGFAAGPGSSLAAGSRVFVALLTWLVEGSWNTVDG